MRYLFLVILLICTQLYAQVGADVKSEKEIEKKEVSESPKEPEHNSSEVKVDTSHSPSKGETEEKNGKKKEEHKHIEVKMQISSDYISRAWALGNEDMARRNNVAYRSFYPAWTFQPTIEFETPIKNLHAEVFFNLWMKDRGDRDNEQRILQSQSGGSELYPKFFSDLQNNDFQTTSSFNGITKPYNPTQVTKYKNQNGMARNDATEITLFYDWGKKNYGRITTGGFHYAIIPYFPPYANILSKTQIFVGYEFPFLRFLNPKISLYHTVNRRNQGNAATGLNRTQMYIPLQLSYKFFESGLFSLTAGTSIGYMYQQNPVNRNSGFSDISSMLKFLYDHYYFDFNWVYRPSVKLWDNNYYFDGASRYIHDGHVTDPSKVYGYENNFVYNQINKAVSDPVGRELVKERYNQQRIIQNLFYISFGLMKQF